MRLYIERRVGDTWVFTPCAAPPGCVAFPGEIVWRQHHFAPGTVPALNYWDGRADIEDVIGRLKLVLSLRDRFETPRGLPVDCSSGVYARYAAGTPRDEGWLALNELNTTGMPDGLRHLSRVLETGQLYSSLRVVFWFDDQDAVAEPDVPEQTHEPETEASAPAPADRTAMNEESGIQDTWYTEAQQVSSVDQLAEFVQKLCTKYAHDYGTICHAMAAAGIAAVRAVNRVSGYGISGSQASAVAMEFTQHWLRLRGPWRIREFESMLFPQYEPQFLTLDRATWEWLQAEARNLLARGDRTDRERVHLETIVAGQVPFGYSVKEG